MQKLLTKVDAPTALLYLFLVLTQIASGVYLAGEREPPGLFDLISALGFLWIVGWWLLQDSRKRGEAWIFDMGLFLYIAWPLIMPYYLCKTRGPRGLLIILGFVLVAVAALVAGIAIYLIFSPA